MAHRTKSFRFRLYPNAREEGRMLAMLESCRKLWNDALAHRKGRWELERRSTSYNTQAWILTAERNMDSDLSDVHSQVAQNVLRRLDRAFRAFFQHRARYPRIKKHRGSGSFTYPQAYNGSVKPDHLRKRLLLSKIGNVKVVFHRPLPKDVRLKTCTVVREASGEWYASLVCEEVVPLQDVKIPAATATITSPIGVDLGLKSLITTSDGFSVPHPKFLKKAERRLKHLQRSFSRKQKNSRNQGRSRHILAVQHARVARRRADYNHKLSTQLVRSHTLIAFEDLRIRNMVRNHSLAKSIHDAGWGQLVGFAEYKAARAGRLVVMIEPAYSTQECFICGALNKIGLSVREFVCCGCGRTLDRDVNAARIVLKRGIAKVGQGMPEPRPVEAGPLPPQPTEVASLTVEAGTGSHRFLPVEDVTPFYPEP